MCWQKAAVTERKPLSLWEAIEEGTELSIFENGIIISGLQPLFEEQGPYTVFGPTNDAFIAFLKNLV